MREQRDELAQLMDLDVDIEQMYPGEDLEVCIADAKGRLAEGNAEFEVFMSLLNQLGGAEPVLEAVA